MAANPRIPVIDPQAIAAAHATLSNSPANADAPGVDKIRELLFGNQMQDYDKRFSMLEGRFQEKLQEMDGESARRLGAVEASVKKQLESIAGQVRQEQDLRTEADKELGHGLRELVTQLARDLLAVLRLQTRSGGGSHQMSSPVRLATRILLPSSSKR